MKRSELTRIINEELARINEKSNVEIESAAKTFIVDVLKLGTRNNIFDMFINKHKLNRDILSDLVSEVGKQLINR